MSEEMLKIIEDMIYEYKETSLSGKMSEREMEIFKEAFLKGINFAENMGTYL